jgi:hypothetical protein
VTTKAWFFPIAHANSADFRAWGSDLSASFANVGLVKTADTGQIDWVTVTRPVVGNTAAGYEIWRFTDSSVYLKIEYGTGGGLASPGMWLTVGTGSSGSGTLTGTVSDRRIIHTSSSTLVSAGTNRQSFLVYKDGFFGFFGYRFADGANNARFFAAVAKTTDSSGAADSRGATVYFNNSTGGLDGPVVQALNFQTATALTINTDSSFVIVPMGITSSIIGVDTQCFLHWTALPLVLPNPYMATVITAEAPAGSTFSTTLVGTASRTYVALDSIPTGARANLLYRLAMLWE